MLAIDWKTLKEKDLPILKEFNDRNGAAEFKIIDKISFEPFMGNPYTAKVLFLALNPGYKINDINTHQDECLLQLIADNLSFKETDYPYYYLHENEKFNKFEGFTWCKRIFKELINEVTTQTLSKKICCIQYHGYHSAKYRPLKRILPSQKITFDFIEQAMDRGIPIVLMRSKKIWFEAIPRLKEYSNLIFINNYRNPTISINNMVVRNDFQRLVDLLNQHK